MTTRYPKGGKGTKWTVKELAAVPAAWGKDKLSEPGLQGEVRVSSTGAVTVPWSTSFKWEGALKWYYCGMSPSDTLESIREQRDWCKEQVKAGINPTDRKRLNKVEAQQAITAALAAAEAVEAREVPFWEMFLDWLEHGVNRQNDNAELLRSFTKDVKPSLGSLPVRLIDERALRSVLKCVVERDALRQAIILHADMTQLFAWAVERKPWRTLLNVGDDGNPMALVEVEPLLPSDYDVDAVGERTLPEAEIRLLANTLAAQRRNYQNAPNRRIAIQPLERTTELSLWLCLSTLCRIGELQKAEWKHVDLVARTWLIPKANQKKVRGVMKDHLVHLSDFAAEQFEELKKLSWDSPFVFPSINDRQKHRDVKTVTKQVYARQLRFHDDPTSIPKGKRYDNSLVIGDEQWSPHDLRRTGATMMEELGASGEIADRCLNHIVGSKVRRTYLKDKHRQGMEEAWDKLGLRLQAILGQSPALRLAA